MAKLIKLTHETLTELLDFDLATGVFAWKVARSNRVKVGSRAGVFHAPSGGRYISIGDEKFMAHRLAFFYVNKRWPNTDVRPSDGNYDNCAIDNLKEISRVELQHGRSKVKTNTSGFQGVSAARRAGKFQSKITWNYKQISLGGSFDTAEEAGAAYAVALEALKTAKTEDDIRSAVSKFRLGKRQRAAWNNILSQGISIAWPSFDAFAADVVDVPQSRYSLVATDMSKPIGPTNYRWATADHPIASGLDGRRAYAKANRAVNKDQIRDRDFRKKYGIDFAEYQRMLVEQSGVCACCERPETRLTDAGDLRMLSVDHNHTTSAVRGLLCSNCNLVLGYACDDVAVLQKAIAYLKKHDPSNVVKFEPSVINGALGNGT